MAPSISLPLKYSCSLFTTAYKLFRIKTKTCMLAVGKAVDTIIKRLYKDNPYIFRLFYNCLNKNSALTWALIARFGVNNINRYDCCKNIACINKNILEIIHERPSCVVHFPLVNFIHMPRTIGLLKRLFKRSAMVFFIDR